MKIKIELDGLTLEQANGLTNFLSSLNTCEEAKQDIGPVVLKQEETYPMRVRRPYTTETKIVNSIEEHDEFCNGAFKDEKSPAIEEKPKQTRKKAEKVDPSFYNLEDAQAPKTNLPKEAITPEPEHVEAIEVVEPEAFSVPTLMQIRSLVAQKAGEHKDAIKAKLVELGAQNVSTLDAKHFQSIFDFLNEL